MAVLIAIFISLLVGLGWMIFELDLTFSVNSYVVLAVFYMTAYCWWLLAKKTYKRGGYDNYGKKGLFGDSVVNAADADWLFKNGYYPKGV